MGGLGKPFLGLGSVYGLGDESLGLRDVSQLSGSRFRHIRASDGFRV